jgi:endonuclease/exonuclease/phosphatase family metal-dependent hydrolase
LRRNQKLTSATISLTAATVVLTAGALAPDHHGDQARADVAPAASSSTSLKILDWNIEGGNSADGDSNWDGIENTIRAENPDIVTLQEVHNDAGQTVDGSPGINQWQTLLNDFPAYDGHFARGDDDGLGGSAGQLILTKYSIAEKVTWTLPNDDSGAVYHSMAGVKVNIGGTDVRIYTTHFSAGAGSAPVARRQAQAQYVLDKMPGTMTAPMLFTGDLNFRPDDTIRPWIAGDGWYDAWTQVNPNIGSDVVTHPGDGEDARIDYVYATAGIDASDAHTDTTTVSDHRPVIVDLTVRGNAAVKAGTVLAGAEKTAGWAHASVFGDGSATLRVCDNQADGWGVRAYVHDKASGDLVVQGTDGAYADRCGTFTTPAGTVGSPLVKVCLYQGSAEKDCREQEVT